MEIRTVLGMRIGVLVVLLVAFLSVLYVLLYAVTWLDRFSLVLLEGLILKCIAMIIERIYAGGQMDEKEVASDGMNKESKTSVVLPVVLKDESVECSAENDHLKF